MHRPGIPPVYLNIITTVFAVHHTTKWLHHGHLQPAIRRTSSESLYASRSRSGTRYHPPPKHQNGTPVTTTSYAIAETSNLATLPRWTTLRHSRYMDCSILVSMSRKKIGQHKQVQEIAPLRLLPTPCAVAHVSPP